MSNKLHDGQVYSGTINIAQWLHSTSERDCSQMCCMGTSGSFRQPHYITTVLKSGKSHCSRTPPPETNKAVTCFYFTRIVKIFFPLQHMKK